MIMQPCTKESKQHTFASEHAHIGFSNSFPRDSTDQVQNTHTAQPLLGCTESRIKLSLNTPMNQRKGIMGYREQNRPQENNTHFVLRTSMALSRRSCHKACRKAMAARCRRGGHQYLSCCLESISSKTTWRQLHSPRLNS